jgi:putative membrane protein
MSLFPEASDSWSWAWQPYPGVWLLVAAIAGIYLRAVHVHGETGSRVKRQRRFFLAGVAVLWLSIDWPLGLLGSGYLASVHMLEYVLFTTVVAPLLLLGTPEWMAREILSKLHAYKLAKAISRPLYAALIVNFILILTHAPASTDFLRSSEVGSIFIDVTWITGGLILWQPIISPLREMRLEHPGVKIVYLFLAAGVVPVLPASFLLLASAPLYETYAFSPRVLDWFDAVQDQQVAGVVMKVGGMPVVWGTMAALMIKWANTERVPGLAGEALEPNSHIRVPAEFHESSEPGD